MVALRGLRSVKITWLHNVQIYVYIEIYTRKNTLFIDYKLDISRQREGKKLKLFTLVNLHYNIILKLHRCSLLSH